MCTNPKWLSKKGAYTDDNWHGKKGEKYEIETWTKCGYCSECVQEKANNWVIRNYYESKGHEKMCFITLTYAKNPFFLVKKDIQDFIKRLRRYLEYRKLDKIRIFYTGEYGSTSNRPHAHIIIYGWNDPKAHYRGLSKKGYPIFYSEIIENKWGLGRTSYQNFSDFEIPYITLYETGKESASYKYRMTKKNAKKRVKKLLEIIKNTKDTQQRASYFNQIAEIEKQINVEKEKYLTVKEFNGWSTGLGFEKFFEEYQRTKEYTFNENIYDKSFATPGSWCKKLANWGFDDARKEMLRRSSELESKIKENPALQNQLRELAKRKDEIIDWQTNKSPSDL